MRPITNSSATAITTGSPPPNANVATVAAPVAQPGHEVASSASPTMISPHGFHSRWKPVMAVCPVASVYRSISMLMKNCIATPTTAAHRNASPAVAAM